MPHARHYGKIMSNPITNKCILLVVDTTHGQIGGTEQNTLRFAQSLLKRGYVPILIEVGLPLLANSVDSTGLQLIHIAAKGFSDVSWKTWRTLLDNLRPGVVVRSKTWVGCINSKLDAVMAISKITYLSWEHHPSLPNRAFTLNNEQLHAFHPRNIKFQLKRAARLQLHMRSAKQTVAVSHAVREPLIEHYPVSATKVGIIYPGVDFDFFQHSPEARKQLRQQWNIPESAFVIGSLGRLAAHKGNDFTLEIMAKLLEKNSELNIWCVIAGKGGDLTRLQELAKKLNIAERVRFPGWQDDAPKAWSAIDVFLMPSSDEGLGMTLIEAAASGCIPIAAKVGGMQEILCGKLDKYLCRPNDIDAWIKVTSSLISPCERSKQHPIIYQDLRKRFDAGTQWNFMVDWVECNS